MQEEAVIRTFVIGLVIASCNNPPPPPRESGDSAHMIATPRGASPNPAITQDRARIETRLQDHQDGIEAAFAAGDCPTIALKRTAVEKRENYTNPPLASELMADELRVAHRRLEEYDNRARELGCELEGCDSFTDIYLDKSSAKPFTVSGTTKSESPACYRVRNTLGERLLSVRGNAKGTSGIPVTTDVATGMQEGGIMVLDAAPIMAFAVLSTELGNDGIEPEGGWKAVPFTVTVTPVLRQSVTGQASARSPTVK